MDRDRSGEIRRTLISLVEKHGFDDVISDKGPIDWDRIFREAAMTSRRLTPQMGAFRDRCERARPALLRIELETADLVEFVAGQYVSIQYEGRTRPYSVTRSPNRDELEFCIRRVPDGRTSPNLCENLLVGDEVTVRGPNGHLLLETQSRRDLIFLATGTGVTPLRGVVSTRVECWPERFR